MLRHHGIYHRSLNSVSSSSSNRILIVSLALNTILIAFFVVSTSSISKSAERHGGWMFWNAAKTPQKVPQSTTVTWHGGHPSSTKSGTCWCGGDDHYCLCTPNLAIDLVITSGTDHLWLVRRKDTGQLATMGGFVNVGESVEAALKRELNEEMGIILGSDPILFGLYSDPRRDNRRHTVSAVYSVQLPEGNKVKPKAGDDAKEVKRIRMSDIEKYEYFADHRTILLDYRRRFETEGQRAPLQESSEGDFANDVARSIC